MDIPVQALRRLARRYPTLLKPFRAPTHKILTTLTASETRTVEGLLDRLTDLLVEDPCLHVAEFHGRFYIDKRSALFRRLVRSGHYEPELSALCLKHIDPARDVLDVGANIGFHSVLFAQQLRDSKVLSLEPTAAAYTRLCRNINLNGVADNVIPQNVAASSTAGSVKIKTIAGREEFSTLGEMVHPAVQGETFVEEQIQTLTVDQLTHQHQLNPGFIKIDVEGAEHLVIAGASDVLSRCRPTILAELSNSLLQKNGSSSHEVVSAIRAHGYDVTDPLRPGIEPGTQDFGDILCIAR